MLRSYVFKTAISPFDTQWKRSYVYKTATSATIHSENCDNY